MVQFWQAVLSDGRVLSGKAQNSSDFLDALQEIGVSRHEIIKVEKAGAFLGRKGGRARAYAPMSALYPNMDKDA